MKCPICGKTITSETHKCPECGHELFNDQITLGGVSQIDNQLLAKKKEEWKKRKQKQDNLDNFVNKSFESPFSLYVYTRPSNKEGSRHGWIWEHIGDTPGSLEIPKNYEIKLDAASYWEIDTIIKFRSLISQIRDDNRVVGLDLSLKPISDSYLEEISSLQHLKWLDISSVYRGPGDFNRHEYFTNDGMIHLGKLINLESLELGHNEHITGWGLHYLENLKNLQELDLMDCINVPDLDLDVLQNMNKLRCLCLLGCKEITDNGLYIIGSLSSLQELNLSGCEKITDVGLSRLANLDQLERLGLRACNNITDQGLKYLTKLKQPLFLDLSYCKRISNEGLLHLANGLGVIWLQITSNLRITKRGIHAALKKNPGMTISFKKGKNMKVTYRNFGGEIKVI